MFFLTTSALSGYNVAATFSVASLLWLLIHQYVLLYEPAVQQSKISKLVKFMCANKEKRQLPTTLSITSAAWQCAISFLCTGLPRTGAKSIVAALPQELRREIVQLAFPELSVLTNSSHSSSIFLIEEAHVLIRWQHQEDEAVLKQQGN